QIDLPEAVRSLARRGAAAGQRFGVVRSGVARGFGERDGDGDAHVAAGKAGVLGQRGNVRGVHRLTLDPLRMPAITLMRKAPRARRPGRPRAPQTFGGPRRDRDGAAGGCGSFSASSFHHVRPPIAPAPTIIASKRPCQSCAPATGSAKSTKTAVAASTTIAGKASARSLTVPRRLLLLRLLLHPRALR